METATFEPYIGFLFTVLLLFVIVCSILVHVILCLVDLIRVRFRKKPLNKSLYIFLYLAMHVYLFAILHPIQTASEKEWLLLLVLLFSFVLFMISKVLISNSVSYLFIKLFKLYKKGEIVKIGTQIGEVQSSTRLFSKLKMHPGKEFSITNKTILRQLIHNYCYDNLQRHTINFQLKNTDNSKEYTNGILQAISSYPLVNRSSKTKFISEPTK